MQLGVKRKSADSGLTGAEFKSQLCFLNKPAHFINKNIVIWDFFAKLERLIKIYLSITMMW